MSNPYDSLIPADFNQNFNHAIEAVINLTKKPCNLYFENAVYIECDNCTNNTPIGLRGPNPFNQGGTGKYSSDCAICQGTGKKPVRTSKPIEMALIWDYKDFYNLGGNTVWPEGAMQTVSDMNLISDIKKCTYAVMNTNINNHNDHKFYLYGEPNPCGLSDDKFIICTWHKK